MKIEQLIELILNILQTHNPGRISINQHANQMMDEFHVLQSQKSENDKLISKSTDNEMSVEDQDEKESDPKKSAHKTIRTVFVQQLDSDERDFISKMSCGVFNNQKILDDCTNLLYASNTQLRPSSKLMYQIYFYYIIYQLPSENFRSFKQLLSFMQPQQILPLMRIIWDDAKAPETVELVDDKQSALSKTAKLIHNQPQLAGDFKNIIDRYFDAEYVNTTLTNGIVTNCIKQAHMYMQQLSQTYEVEEKVTKSTKTNTVPQPFNLTQPKQKLVGIEVAPPMQQQIKPDHEMLSKNYNEVMNDRTQQIKSKAKETIKPDSKYDHLTQKPKREVKEKPASTTKVSPKTQTQHKTTMRPTSGLPQISNKPPPSKPKLNKNQILKENALVEKQLQKQADDLKSYMNGMKDSSEYETWRTQMQAKDDAERAAQVEIRKQEITGLRQKVADLVKLQQNQKQAEVQEFQVQNLQLALQIVEKEQEELLQRKENNDKFAQELAQKIQEAKDNSLKEKQDIANTQKALIRELKAEANDLKDIQLMERQNYIKQIKAMLEVQSAKRVETMANKFDPSTVKDFGLLDQMSITELKERLHKMKDFELQLLEKKRKQIEEDKIKEEQELMMKQERINQMKKAIVMTKNQQRIGDSVYNDMVQQVKQYTNDLISTYQQSEEKRQRSQEIKRKEVEENKEQIKSQAELLKQKLKQLQEAKSTTKIFNSNTQVQEKTYKPVQMIKNETKFNQVENRQKQEQQEKLQKEFEEKQKIAKQLEEDTEMKRKAQVQKEREIREERKRKAALIDPYKAKMSGINQ
ncbi:Conserved_hypothetical protein [Hexamita inflata]|uniref:Uncharacterized protein n=1 Tax=Hexamita inflata TaxID=28002 RepID=A0ABP1JHF2_9EUKA